MKSKVEIYEEVRSIFSTFLEKNSFRKTPERFSILEEIYKRSDHFEAETLYTDLKSRKLDVSRATVYNTLDLLVSCDLVKKHQFGATHALYEKSYAYNQHDHLICVRCNKVIEFCDPRIQQIKSTMQELFNFNISHHSLNLYGTCEGECDAKSALKEKSNEYNIK